MSGVVCSRTKGDMKGGLKPLENMRCNCAKDKIKGVRLVSAKQETDHKKGIQIIKSKIF
jgi:hypothetical protein